jgi:hypothetical protein
MQSSVNRRVCREKACGFVLTFLLCAMPAFSQTCFTSDDMDAPTRSALQVAASRYFDMVARGDAAIKQNSTSSVANDFSAIENTIKESKADLAGAHATPPTSISVEGRGHRALQRAEFLCGVFGATGQTNSAEFII